MFKKFIAVAVFGFLGISFLIGQPVKPEPAENILKAAMEQARATQKPIFLIFHASWCGWCKRLDKALESSELKKVFEDSYVVATLDVLESKEKAEELENPGGREIMVKLDGEKSGLPFYAFLDETGKKIADSNALPGTQNVGYPAAPEEIEAFEKLLKSSAPHMAEMQRRMIVDYLKKNSPQR